MHKMRTESCRMQLMKKLKMKIFRKMWMMINADSFIITGISMTNIMRTDSKNCASAIAKKMFLTLR